MLYDLKHLSGRKWSNRNNQRGENTSTTHNFLLLVNAYGWDTLGVLDLGFSDIVFNENVYQEKQGESSDKVPDLF